MKTKDNKTFASVTWAAADIKALRPKWSSKKCETFLEDNERRIQDRMIEAGWAAIETLLEG